MTAEADLVVVGGGVMGLFTAYHAAERGARVAVLDRGRIGDPATASFGLTRSFRSDYLDPAYARLAREAVRLWGEFEARTGTPALIRCGCLNVAKRTVTPALPDTYAQRSSETLASIGHPTQALDGPALSVHFPYLDGDLGRLETDAGMVDLPAVTASLLRVLAERSVQVIENVEITAVSSDDGALRITTDAGEHLAGSVVVTAGHGTNEILALTEGCDLRVPITRDRPVEAKYFKPPAWSRRRFNAETMPVVAYLDAGIYCHPIVDGLTDAVKIGYYHPPDLPRTEALFDGIADFVDQCLPGLLDAEVTAVEGVDGCDYDLVADDDFVLGPVPGVPRVHVGVGWRGTGYKFAPWVGRVLADLALHRGTVYDLARFDPARFVTEQGGRGHEPSVVHHA